MRQPWLIVSKHLINILGQMPFEIIMTLGTHQLIDKGIHHLFYNIN